MKYSGRKEKINTQKTTLRKPDGSLIADLNETLKHMLEYFTPEDKEVDDTDNHRLARIQSQEPVDRADEEIRNTIESMRNKKAPAEDGIPGKIYKSSFEIFPNYITAMYNECLRRGVFPERWKRAKRIPITKPGKENSEDFSEFRPISLLNTGGQVLEKVLINRINHHIYSHDIMNTNQYGFTPQGSTIDSSVAVKDFVEEGLVAGTLSVSKSICKRRL